MHADVRPRQLKVRFGSGVLTIVIPLSNGKVRVEVVPAPSQPMVTLYVLAVVKTTLDVSWRRTASRRACSKYPANCRTEFCSDIEARDELILRIAKDEITATSANVTNTSSKVNPPGS